RRPGPTGAARSSPRPAGGRRARRTPSPSPPGRCRARPRSRRCYRKDRARTCTAARSAPSQRRWLEDDTTARVVRLARRPMRSAVRIAVVWQSTTPVEALCRAVANARPTANVAVFHDPVADGETIRRLQPSVLVAALDAPDSEGAGALRMLRALLGGIGVVLLAPAARLSEARVLAGKLEAQLLP